MGTRTVLVTGAGGVAAMVAVASAPGLVLSPAAQADSPPGTTSKSVATAPAFVPIAGHRRAIAKSTQVVNTALKQAGRMIVHGRGRSWRVTNADLFCGTVDVTRWTRSRFLSSARRLDSSS